jgi:ribosomal protein S12 methylthiotransferase accessory factor
MSQVAICPLELGIPFVEQNLSLFDANFGVFSEMDIERNHLLGRSFYSAITRIRDTRRLGPTGSMGQGGGITRERACCRALGEAIERTSSHYRPRPGDLFGSFNELHKQHPLVDPLRFPRRTVGTFLLPNMTHLSRDSMLRWTEAENLSTGEKAYLPSTYVYMPHTFAPDEHWVEFSLSSGLASGATEETATLSGMLELAERDAFSLAWLRMADTAPLPAPLLQKLHRLFPAFDRGVHLHDISNDLGIPVVLATFLGAQPDMPQLAMGAAASETLEAAALKSLEELAGCMHYGYKILQAKTPPIASPEEIQDFHDHARYWLHHFEPDIAAWLSHNRRESAPTISFRNSTDIIEHWRRLGKEVYRVKLTIPEYEQLGLHIVRIVMPELQPLWVKHGFAQLETTRIDELRKRGDWPSVLNPHPHPFP